MTNGLCNALVSPCKRSMVISAVQESKGENTCRASPSLHRMDYRQCPGRQTHSWPRCTHCPGNQAVVRGGGLSQWPGVQTQPLFQVQEPGTQTCPATGGTPTTSSRGGGGGCGTITSAGGGPGSLSLTIVVSRVTTSRCSRLPHADRASGTKDATRMRDKVIRRIAYFSLLPPLPWLPYPATVGAHPLPWDPGDSTLRRLLPTS
jgi:hypothetical protein